MHDIRHALRRWRHRPGFALTAIGTLALGIAATTAMFSVVDAVLLRPLPYADPDRLVAIHAVFPDRRQNPAAALTWNRGHVSYLGWDALREEKSFSDVAAWTPMPLTTTFGDARMEIVHSIAVSARFLPMLGVRLVHGRFFTDDEDNASSTSILITHEAWQRLYGGRPDIIGQPARIGHASSGDDEAKVVVGVLERGFVFDGDPAPEVLVPVGGPAQSGRRYPGPSLRIVARLASGVTPVAAAAAADRVIREVERREPTYARVLPLADDIVRGASQPLFVLFGGAGLLLLIACSNVAGLLLGEARARWHEIAVRAALGGSHARVVRQLLVEHAMLGTAGAVAGLALAYVLIKVSVTLAPGALPRVADVALDARVVAFALGLGVLTLIVFGVAPALSLARTPATRALAEGGRDGAAGRHMVQRVVVSGAIALALALLVGASLLGETLFRLTARPLGFDPDGLTVVSFRMTTLPNLPPPISKGDYDARTPAQRDAASQVLAQLWTLGWWQHTSGAFDRLAALPGVTAVAGGYTAPFLGVRMTTTIRAAGRPANEAISSRQHSVTGRYFETMKTPILKGRNFEASDRIGIQAAGFFRRSETPPPRVTVISAELERRFFGGDGVGRQLITGSASTTEGVLDVIGVVPDARWSKTDDNDLAAFYVLAEAYNSVNAIFIRTVGESAASASVIRSSLKDYNPNIVVTSTATMGDLLALSMAEERLRAALSMIFGGASLVLAAVGLYGLAARRVADRRREIGVRIALGARPGDVRRLVLLDGLRTIAMGLLIGLPAAFAAAQLTRTFLYGVTSTSLRVFVAAVAALSLAALIATLLPARRAAMIDPLRILRE